MSARSMLIFAAILGALAVAGGAFGAHVLAERLTAHEMEIYQTAARYQMYHALALAITGLAALHISHTLLTIAAYCYLFGTIIFSGLLYALALGGPAILGMFVPIGGTALIVGWVLLALAVAKVMKA